MLTRRYVSKERPQSNHEIVTDRWIRNVLFNGFLVDVSPHFRPIRRIFRLVSKKLDIGETVITALLLLVPAVNLFLVNNIPGHSTCMYSGTLFRCGRIIQNGMLGVD
jgi:hypothetical protein